MRDFYLIADDFGIGPETTRGILDLGRQGLLTATVAMVNSPFIENSVQEYFRLTTDFLVGWHPNLTMDKPVCQPKAVPSLVNQNNDFYSLNKFVTRALLGMIRGEDVYLELKAQLLKYMELFGGFPHIINAHQHIAIFPVVGNALRRLCLDFGMNPWMRRVYEPKAGGGFRGPWFKRSFLTHFGWKEKRLLDTTGFPGNVEFGGICDFRKSPDITLLNFTLQNAQAHGLEWMCHPGYYDKTLVCRDVKPVDPSLGARVRELEFFKSGNLENILKHHGFQLVRSCSFREKVTPLKVAA